MKYDSPPRLVAVVIESFFLKSPPLSPNPLSTLVNFWYLKFSLKVMKIYFNFHKWNLKWKDLMS